MAIIDILLPSLGEGITDATILKWHKNPGDTINEDDTLVDIATDKVDSEVPSPTSGILVEKLCDDNQVVTVGSVIARIDNQDGQESENKDQQSETKEEPTEQNDIEQVPYQPESQPAIISEKRAAQVNGDEANNGFFSPLVINIARTEGIPLSELEKIKGTGKDGRVSKEDILSYVEQIKSGTQPEIVRGTRKFSITHTDVVSIPKPSFSKNGANEIIEMDRMRKLIARNMKESQNQAATVTSFEEADVTGIVQWREKNKKSFEASEGTKLTFTPIFFDCVVRVLKRYPMINSSIDGDNIILKKDINIGMATALPSGNLIVPVIQKAAYLNLAGLAKEVNSLAQKARNNQLKPLDTQGGTFTITNVGSFGSITGTPIINIPEVAILALGSIKKKPVVIETDNGDTIGIRHIMMLSLSYDHRIIDGALGSIFLHEIVKEMEAWDVNRSV
ncbi:MAG: diapophytoene dehydrogenase [Pseudopedobacter saltans]|uniref:Dihydrolipoamide acetyltransferase component of pyruvate dehydrogenase complex n=1 Tax=Pseudopedobacter saltans TaxID=151895 RepID=A0A2W5H9W8_9SPHI|nr:MAG: diapophytoene dehydrogenase [Pseudopedobacter saltans]